MKRSAMIVIGLLSVFLTVSLQAAEAPTVDEIIDRANQQDVTENQDGDPAEGHDLHVREVFEMVV